jgi:hypothetical protein
MRLARAGVRPAARESSRSATIRVWENRGNWFWKAPATSQQRSRATARSAWLSFAPFDAAIVCQSLNPDCAVRLAERLHRYHPGIRVLRIRLYASDHHIGYDGTCDSLAGPEKLLESIQEILMGEQRGNSLVRPAV